MSARRAKDLLIYRGPESAHVAAFVLRRGNGSVAQLGSAVCNAGAVVKERGFNVANPAGDRAGEGTPDARTRAKIVEIVEAVSRNPQWLHWATKEITELFQCATSAGESPDAWKALQHVADEIDGQLASGCLAGRPLHERIYWSQVSGVAKEALRARGTPVLPPMSAALQPSRGETGE